MAAYLITEKISKRKSTIYFQMKWQLNCRVQKYTVKTSAFVVGFEKILLESAPDRSCGYRVQLYKAPIYRGFLLSDYRITGL